MAKNFKGKAQRPPLSLVDKMIYGLLILLLLYAATFGSTYLGTGVARRNAFADPSVVAGDGDIGSFYALPFCIFSIVLAVLVYTHGLKKRQPIFFGNKNYKTPVFAHTIKTYPLFSQDFRDQLHPESRQRLKRISLLLAAILLACLLLLPFGFYSRRVLTNDHQLITYDSFNRISDSHHIREADRVLIGIRRPSSRSYNSFNLELDFVFEDTTYFLDIKDFRNMSREEALRYIISLKEVLGPGEYEIHNSERLEWQIMNKNYSPTEAELLYQLFDMES